MDPMFNRYDSLEFIGQFPVMGGKDFVRIYYVAENVGLGDDGCVYELLVKNTVVVLGRRLAVLDIEILNGYYFTERMDEWEYELIVETIMRRLKEAQEKEAAEKAAAAE